MRSFQLACNIEMARHPLPCCHDSTFRVKYNPALVQPLGSSTPCLGSTSQVKYILPGFDLSGQVHPAWIRPFGSIIFLCNVFAVTVLSAMIMTSLFVSELRDYLNPTVTEELFVDTSRGSKLRINFDFIIPTISCDFLVLDAMDTSGEQHLQIDHNIFKRRLELLSLKPIEEPKKEDIGGSEHLTEKKVEDTDIVTTTTESCGSCYGAETIEIKCCNTCEAVKDAYRRRKWALTNFEKISQCKNENNSEKMSKAFNEACQIYGSMEVNRVGGSFHIAPGQSFSINHVHVHDVQPFSSSSFNTSHHIRHLSFGRTIQGVTNPIDGIDVIAHEGKNLMVFLGTSRFSVKQWVWNVVRLSYVRINELELKVAAPVWKTEINVWRVHCDDHMPFIICRSWPSLSLSTDGVRSVAFCLLSGATMFQYYIKIVPTTYVRRDGAILQTNQFSVTKHQKSVSIMTGDSGMPGIFFSYELAPVMVKISEKEK
uniref:Endoplasmic reticulum-Golgi intermediate compartment protein 3 n=1 Tax=Timema bartmani TaxID=61472 RepID=A0A7R9ERN3_9NEOP|nr:unnamed protein product [Timema bartmani]